MMQPTQAPDITRLLEAWTGGDRAALDALMPSVIDELRRMAAMFLAREGHARTLQATALVNEAYLRLARVRPRAWESRAQFFALTARIMRRILVDHARAKLAEYRGGGVPHISLDAATENQAGAAESLLSLDEALLTLERADPRRSKLVELRVFCGLSNVEAAEALGVSERTVVRDWQFVKAWLARELNYPALQTD